MEIQKHNVRMLRSIFSYTFLFPPARRCQHDVDTTSHAAIYGAVLQYFVIPAQKPESRRFLKQNPTRTWLPASAGMTNRYFG